MFKGNPPSTREDMDKVKRSFQSQALRNIKSVHAPNAEERIRSKVDRWRGLYYGLQGIPGRYAPCMAQRIIHWGKLVPPRVQAAVFTTLWNGWCTHRRFQKRSSTDNVCRFKCSSTSEDSLEHYCRCPVVPRVARHILHFSYPPELALNVWMLNSYWLDIDYNMRGAALLIYGTYMAFNTIRHKGIADANQAYKCITQFCKLGAGGDDACISHLDGCWHRPMNYVC